MHKKTSSKRSSARRSVRNSDDDSPRERSIGLATSRGFCHHDCLDRATMSADSDWRGVRVSHEISKWPLGKPCAICGGNTPKPGEVVSVVSRTLAPTAASIHALIEPHARHDGRSFSMADAQEMREAMIWAALRGGREVERLLGRANKELSAHGIESIDRSPRTRSHPYFGSARMLYVNMGDPYLATIMYDTVAGRFYVRSWGDFVEKHR
jgi:hypothetical protein